MTLRRASHAVYETSTIWYGARNTENKYDWGNVQKGKSPFFEIAGQFDFEIQECEIAKDHVQLLVSYPPRYSVSKVVAILKIIPDSKVLKEYSSVRKKLWAGYLWEQGYFFRKVGEQVTDDIIRQYIQKHNFSEEQLEMFE